MRSIVSYFVVAICVLAFGDSSARAGRVVQFEILVDDRVVFVAGTLDRGERGPDLIWETLSELPLSNPAERFVVSDAERERLAAFHRQLDSDADPGECILQGPVRIFCRYAGDITVPELRLVRNSPQAPWKIPEPMVRELASKRTVDPQRRTRAEIDRERATTSVTPPAASSGPTESAASAKRYAGFSGYSRNVTVKDPEAQAWFDQGIQWLYGFNHDEAIRSFERAAEIDPTCAMAWWGSAYARGLHINNPLMSEEQSRLAHQAAQKALAALDTETPAEKGLVHAVAQRYTVPPPEDRAPLDQAYAAAMEALWHQFPDDADIAALFAESLMNLQPWDLWTHDAKPKGRALEIVAVLERTLERHPKHPGANHFYIHAIEASPWPERGVPAAERLLDLVPGSGHLVHMPSHIFIRVGRYADAAETNARAIAADDTYLQTAPPPEFYNIYFLHNVHFLAYASMMEGRLQPALAAARRIEQEIPREFLKNFVTVADGFMPTALHVLIRFGKWEEILLEPEPEPWRLLSRAERHFARSVALSNLKRLEEADAERKQLQAIEAMLTPEWRMGNNSASDVVAIASWMAEGEWEFHSGRHDAAFQALRRAVQAEDQLAYDEPPGWMQPVRHALGALLLAADRNQEAEQVYREDLRRHPSNAWSLLGLQQSLVKQGKVVEAEEMQTQVDQAWVRADVVPIASCYCHPHASVSAADESKLPDGDRRP